MAQLFRIFLSPHTPSGLARRGRSFERHEADPACLLCQTIELMRPPHDARLVGTSSRDDEPKATAASRLVLVSFSRFLLLAWFRPTERVRGYAREIGEPATLFLHGCTACYTACCAACTASVNVLELESLSKSVSCLSPSPRSFMTKHACMCLLTISKDCLDVEAGVIRT